MARQEEQPIPPPGWPEGVPLPTMEEAEEAVRQVGELMKKWKKEAKESRKKTPSNFPPTDYDNITITI